MTEKISLGDGIEIPIEGTINIKGIGEVPILDVRMLTDYEWQLSALHDRLEHPERYSRYEDVAQTVAKLKDWLRQHAQEAEKGR